VNLVFFTHPEFLGLQSQGHFARMLVDACRERGHTVELRQPAAVVRRWVSGRAAKWAGYLDQYLVFPRQARAAMRHDPPTTLYIFCDQALGPWVPLAADRPHVVHCHDLLALRSALGLISENPTKWTGRVYQRYIRAGFRHARHFISVSAKSRADLHEFGGVTPDISEVVYNGLNYPYRPQSRADAKITLDRAGLNAAAGFVLHIGGGQWYKNTSGVIQMYARYAARRAAAGLPVLALWLLSPSPSPAVQTLIDDLPAEARVRFLPRLDHQALESLYSCASALLFPSLAEGFGWPIAEALACGCPVITTGDAPMTEVGGSHAHYLPRYPGNSGVNDWAEVGARLLCSVLDRSPAERDASAQAGIAWVRRFDPNAAIDAYLAVYERVLRSSLALDRAQVARLSNAARRFPR
jgi:glycosyltransferase involved in cell wall biosynthesis